MQKAIDGASKWVDGRMASADLVAVAAIGSSLQILTDFTSSKEQVRTALTSLAAASGTAFDAVDTSTASSDDAAQSATDDATATDQSAQELDTFNNDVRLRALKTLAEALAADPAEKGDPVFQLGHAAQRHRQPGGAARGGERGASSERRDLSDRRARIAGGRAGRQRAAGQPRRSRRVQREQRRRISSRSSPRSRTR